MRSKPGHPATTTGIRWLCYTAIVRLPWSRRPWALPFLTIPAPSRAVSTILGARHQTLPERAARVVRLLRRWLPDRPIVLVGDSGFGVVELARAYRQAKVTWVARMRMTAALYAPVPPQPTGKPGVKPKKGPRRPTPAQVLANPATPWGTIRIRWYDGETKTFDAFSQTVLWHRDGFDPVPIRWIMLRDPAGELKPMARELVALVLAMALGLAISLLVTLVWKISIHGAVVAGATVILVPVVGPRFLGAIPRWLPLSWARVEVGDHTPTQAVAGAVLGVAVAAIVFTLPR